ncbi:MAG TPA: pilus assembly protein TadG-related protein [Bryobacteraceae bacterium]|nr:pilus assembly protein TadG-related protein [Bryobacteraceae bacterium]
MKAKQRGFVLIAMSVTMLLLLAVMGLAFDFGRIYIARNEAQVFTDAAAMAAAVKLDGTATGLAKAREAVAKLPMRWNFGTREFSGVIVEFSGDGAKWEKNPSNTSGVTMARVTAPSNVVEITFLRAVGGPALFTVPASSAAASNPVRLIE